MHSSLSSGNYAIFPSAAVELQHANREDDFHIILWVFYFFFLCSVCTVVWTTLYVGYVYDALQLWYIFFSFLFSMARICVSVYLSVKQSVAAEQLNNNRPVWAGFGPSWTNTCRIPLGEGMVFNLYSILLLRPQQWSTEGYRLFAENVATEISLLFHCVFMMYQEAFERAVEVSGYSQLCRGFNQFLNDSFSEQPTR